MTDMSTKLSRQQSIPSEVIALAYYEYTDDTEGKSNQWSKFQKDPKLMSKLIGVLCKGRLVDVRFLDVNQAPDSQAIHNVFSQLQSFSLEEFRKTYYEIYTELVDHKRNLLQAITDYGLKPEETIKNQILLFVPQQKSRSDWVSELLTKSAELLSVDSVVLELMYYEKSNDYSRRKQAWENLRSKDKVNEFADFLLRQKQIGVPSNYTENENIVSFVTGKIAEHKDYSLIEVAMTVSNAFGAIETQKRTLSQAIEHYASPMKEEDRVEFQSLLTSSSNSELTELTQFIGRKLGASEIIVQLFHLTYMQKEAEEKSLFEDIQKSDKINELAEILVSKRKIEPPEIDRAEAISDLSSILKVMEHFDLIKAQNLLNRYYALMNYSKQLTEFMISEELTQNQVLFDFENVLKIMEKHLEADIIQQLKIMTVEGRH